MSHFLQCDRDIPFLLPPSVVVYGLRKPRPDRLESRQSRLFAGKHRRSQPRRPGRAAPIGSPAGERSCDQSTERLCGKPMTHYNISAFGPQLTKRFPSNDVGISFASTSPIFNALLRLNNRTLVWSKFGFTGNAGLKPDTIV